jgi:Fe-S oxidoreductase/nitrate reductase gamma subunit
MLTSFDALLIAAAILILGVGLARRSSAWLKGREEDRKGSISNLIGYLAGSRKILKRRLTGSAHLLVFWGVALPAFAIIAAQFRPLLPEILSKFLSLFLDFLGLAMLFATVFFLLRRLKRREEDGAGKTMIPVLTLFGIVLTGFLAEGTRLSILEAGFSWETPIGSLFSILLPGSPLLMQSMIRLHFLVVLFLIGSLPFTFMRHMVSASLNVLYGRLENPGRLREVSLERDYPGAKEVSDFSWKQLLDAEACVSCGRCEENCPASISGKPLSPRRVVRKIFDLMEGADRRKKEVSPPSLEETITNEEIWACTTCMACIEHCPVCIEPLDKIMDMRRYRVMEKGALPPEAKTAIRNLEIYGDVHGKGISHRLDWAFNRGVPLVSEASEVLLWVGCAGAFHPRYQDAARAMAKILKAAGVPFGILGKEELCCGDPARRLGEESLFLDLAEKNIARLRKYGLKKILTLCPHCFNALKNEYRSLGSSMVGTPMDVVHAVEFMWALIRDKRITLTYAFPSKVALHDPCYLGRGNGIYEPLREISRAVRGVEVVELPRNRERGFCCGGGGGGMWLHERVGKRINQLRAEEVVRSGAQVIGTACPYCLTMLEDGVKSLEVDHSVRVLDLVELVASSIR